MKLCQTKLTIELNFLCGMFVSYDWNATNIQRSTVASTFFRLPFICVCVCNASSLQTFRSQQRTIASTETRTPRAQSKQYLYRNKVMRQIKLERSVARASSFNRPLYLLSETETRPCRQSLTLSSVPFPHAVGRTRFALCFGAFFSPCSVLTLLQWMRRKHFQCVHLSTRHVDRTARKWMPMLIFIPYDFVFNSVNICASICQ